jgi:hypothetical protein
MKTNNSWSLLVLVTALVISIAPFRLRADTSEKSGCSANEASTAQWSVQVKKIDLGDINLAPSFQAAIYESLLDELGKSKQFRCILRDGAHSAGDIDSLLILKTTVEKYTAGSETKRAVTTVGGATKLSVRSQLSTRDGKIILDRTVNGNVRFMGSNLKATHNLARNIAKTIKKSPLSEAVAAAGDRNQKSKLESTAVTR